MHINRNFLFPALALLVCMPAATSSGADPAPPVALPAPTPVSVTAVQSIVTSQQTCARTALAVAARSDWTAFRASAACAEDARVRALLAWRLALGDRNASFDELSQALAMAGDFPRTQDLRERALAALDRTSLTAEQRLAWIAVQPNLSADGTGRLALALADTHQDQTAASYARAAFVKEGLSEDVERRLWARFSSSLNSRDVAQRVTLLQWQGAHDRARLYFAHLPDDARVVAEAWAAVAVRVPTAVQNHPGALLTAVQRARRSGDDEDAARLALTIDPTLAPSNALPALFQERRRYVATWLGRNDGASAYALVANSGLDRGELYADAEFTAGWIALRALHDPVRAQTHFSRLASRVTAPVSVARAYYWLSLADQAAGQGDRAVEDRARAAALAFTFYGQLAGGALGQARQAVPISTEDRAAFEQARYVDLLHLLADAGDRQGFEILATETAANLTTPGQVALLSDLARTSGFAGVAVRCAKIGLRRGFVIIPQAYPLGDVPTAARRVGPEHALILAIARQESEWDPGVVSPVGARGLMQLMPATARLTAQHLGQPYRLASLTGDANYNMLLGSSYLNSLVSQFDGSYVLAIAAYNAGPARVNEWITQLGDPRMRSIDTVDWIESIPFSETRNYVERVLENVQVYRQILGARSPGPSLAPDLERGARDS